MAEIEQGLVGLREYHQDLLELEQGQLRHIDRLRITLEARVNEFRHLLEKASKNETSRKTILSGSITIDDEEYSINQEFQENSTQLADTLDLDEIRSAQLLLEVQEDADFLERSNTASAIILFHEQREYLLECLRLLLRGSLDLDSNEATRIFFQESVEEILETRGGPADHGSIYARRCMGAMSDIERWLQSLEERRQGVLALGQDMTDEGNEILAFQQKSLGQQHESLGAITTHLIKASQTGINDFYKLLDHLPKLERWNNIAIHYVPIIIAFAGQFGSPEGGGILHDARALNKRIFDNKDSAPWLLRNLQVASEALWLAEYSGWYLEQPAGSPVQHVNLHEEARHGSDSFMQALRDGAFECILSICSQVVPDEWYDPAKDALIQLLLRDSMPPAQDPAPISSHFQTLLMEQFEAFTHAFITNMPDTLRQFKFEEDDQRKRFRANLQQGAPNAIPEQIFHLERFLVIMSFAYADRNDAAQAFWSDTDSNLYGFLQWASKRQSTPCVSAFCEMFRSISGGEDSATSAHHFLLEESSSTSAKIRKSHTLSWSQIFGELNLYTSRIREQPTALRPTIQYGARPGPDELDEPESPILLECYLRLIDHICCESVEARSWIISQSDYPILEALLHLCGSTVPDSLQASIFGTLQGLLTDKPRELGMTLWSIVDQWVSGVLSPAPNPNRPSKISPVTKAEQFVFETMAESFEKANQFTALLHSLTCSSPQETGLNDQLPFPETLGSTYRMSGIEPYVDFVFDKVFASKVPHLEDQLQQKILTWNVLRFAAVCLETFNEDLVVLANKSSIPVDDAMDASSLRSYVRLHPFARVMEWMFDERVLTALFRSAHHDVDEVSSASPTSPLLFSLLSCIDVMNLIMDLQSTYLDIVRPLVKLQSSGRKHTVTNPSLASFEDSVALNLQLIVDLAYYSGVGNQHLTVSSLKLLAKLASSRKLNTQATLGSSNNLHGNRLITVIEQNGDLIPIVRALTLAMQFDARELDQGKDSPGWIIKSVTLDFLNHCLSASPEKPTLAHALLGYSCKGSTVDIEPGSLFANGQSLFHAVLQIALDYPDGNGFTMQGWSLSLKQKGMQVLSTLWSSPLTSIFTLSELRLRDFAFHAFCRQVPTSPDTPWDGRIILDPEFICTESAEALEQFLWQRCSLMEYTSTEIRLVASEAVPSLKEKVFSTMLGTTVTPEGEQISNMTMFDLFDFTELDPSKPTGCPELKYLTGLDFNLSVGAGFPTSEGLFNIGIIHEMILLRLNDLRKSGLISDPNLAQQADEEAKRVLLFHQGQNNHLSLTTARLQTMKAWADLVTLAIGTCELGSGEKATLILQALQMITPKLAELAMRNAQEAKEEAKTVLALLFQLDFGASALDTSRAGDIANDRLFQLFRTALRAISCPDTDMHLREILYKISYRYLSGMAQTSDTVVQYRDGVQTLKSAGEKTMDIICDDAYGASATCRISALLLLNALGDLAKKGKSGYIIEALAKSNFIQILVESIENIPQELRETDSKDIPFLLSYYESKLALLLTISQSRTGAVHVTDAGLFLAIRNSGLFSVDPDIGVEIDNPEALSKYYRLLVAIVRVITSVVLSRGSQNAQSLETAKLFLVDNRPLVVAVFKRQARVGGVSFDDAGVDIEELVELFMLLIAMTGFLDYEEQRDTHKFPKVGFT